MVDFVVRVIVDPGPAQRGLRGVEQGLGRVNSAAERTNQLLRSALAAAAGFASGRAVIDFADQLTSLQNRLRLVTDGTQNLGDVTDELFRISNDTRASFSATAILYSRTAQATKDLGLSQRDTLNFTEQLNQAVALSGATAVEAQNAIIQLSQGLAAGALRGEEFNSVSEQLPAVLDVIARETGKTRGELRALAAEGKITADVVINAFSNASERLQSEFNITEATIGQAFTIINNQLQQIGLEFLNATNITQIFAKALIDLGDNLPTVISGLTALAIVIGVRLAAIAIPAAISGLAALGVAIIANPITAFATAIVSAGAVLIAFQGQLADLGGNFTELSDTVGAIAFLIGDSFSALLDGINALLPANAQLTASFDSAAGVINSALLGLVAVVDVVRASFLASVASIEAAWNNFPAALREIGTRAANGLLATIEFAVNGAIRLINQLPGVGSPFPTIQIPRFELPDNTPVADAFNRVLERQTGFLRERVQGSLEDARALRLRNTAETQSSITTERGTRLVKANTDEKKKLTQAQRDEQRVLDLLRGAQMEYNTDLAALNRLLAQGRITTDEYTRGLNELRLILLESDRSFNTAANGAERFFLRLQQESQTSADFIDGALNSTLDGLSGAFERLANTGKFSFRDLTNSILQDVNRLASRGVAEQVLGAFSGASGGGGFDLFGVGSNLLGGLSGALPFFNDGGSIRVGGNAGRDNNLLSVNGEAVARVSRGETISVTPQEQNSGGVTVNMTVVTRDAESFQRSQQQIASSAAQALDRARRRNT